MNALDIILLLWFMTFMGLIVMIFWFFKYHCKERMNIARTLQEMTYKACNWNDVEQWADLAKDLFYFIPKEDFWKFIEKLERVGVPIE